MFNMLLVLGHAQFNADIALLVANNGETMQLIANYLAVFKQERHSLSRASQEIHEKLSKVPLKYRTICSRIMVS